MYYGRKKGIIIGIVVAIVVILIAIAGVLLATKTDLFKSNKTLFWKYMESGIGSNKTVSNTQLEEIEKLKMQSPYTMQGELTLNSTDEQINKTLEKLKLSVNSETDKSNNYSHANAKINFADTSIFNIDYANTDNIYALKSEEIVTVYLGVRNENLKVLLQKLGVEDIKDFPDEITQTNYNDLFKFSEEELNHIKQTYMPVIENGITENSYSKQTESVIEKDGVSYNTTSYRLDLTGMQISDILVNMLNTLKTDSITLNLVATKAKILGAGNITVEDVNNAIDDIIDRIDELQFEDISFVVYSYKGETIATEILIKNKQKITIYNNSNQNMKIIIEDLSTEAQYDIINIEIVAQATTTRSSIVMKIAIDDNALIELNVTNEGSAAQKSLNTNVSLAFTSEGETTEFLYNQTMEFVSEIENMQKLDQTNCAILNDYSQEELMSLLQAIMNQISVVYNQKAQIIGMPTTVDTTTQNNIGQ